jgi:hypothetical protein
MVDVQRAEPRVLPPDVEVAYTRYLDSHHGDLAADRGGPGAMTTVERGLTLVTYTDQYAEALADVLSGRFDPDDPEQAAALEQSLERLDESGVRLRDKAQKVGGAAKSLRVWAGELARERAELERREASYIRQAEWLEQNLLVAMETAGVDRFEGQRFTIRVQVNPPHCEVIDPDAVPIGFLRHIPEKVIPERWEVNKVAINAASKEGEVVPGTIVTRSKKVVISS